MKQYYYSQNPNGQHPEKQQSDLISWTICTGRICRVTWITHIKRKFPPSGFLPLATPPTHTCFQIALAPYIAPRPTPYHLPSTIKGSDWYSYCMSTASNSTSDSKSLTVTSKSTVAGADRREKESEVDILCCAKFWDHANTTSAEADA